MNGIVIEEGNARCTVVKGDSAIVATCLTVDDPKARFDPRFKFGGWDGKVRFYDNRTNSFPAGLLPRVVDHCQASGMLLRVRSRDNRVIDTRKISTGYLFGRDIRDYQMLAARAALLRKRGCIDAATNAGKSTIAAVIVTALYEQLGISGLVLVPNKLLLNQLCADIREMAGARITVGQIGDGKMDTGADVIISTAQTIINGCDVLDKNGNVTRKGNPKLAHVLRRVGCIVVDEAHHSSAATWARILESCNAEWRIGMTGSYLSHDKVKQYTFEGGLGPVIYKVSNETLMKRGISAQAHVWMLTDPSLFRKQYTLPDVRIVKKRSAATGKLVEIEVGTNFLERQKHEYKLFLKSNKLAAAFARIAEACVAGRLKPLIMVNEIAHMDKLAAACKARGLAPVCVWGKVSPLERKRRITEFERDATAVLLGSSVLDEGFNAPTIGAVILTSGGQSVRQIKQRIGRAIRAKSSGFNATLVIDVLSTNGHYLHKHAEARVRLYKSEKFPVYKAPQLKSFCAKVAHGWKALLPAHSDSTP